MGTFSRRFSLCRFARVLELVCLRSLKDKGGKKKKKEKLQKFCIELSARAFCHLPSACAYLLEPFFFFFFPSKVVPLFFSLSREFSQPLRLPRLVSHTVFLLLLWQWPLLTPGLDRLLGRMPSRCGPDPSSGWHKVGVTQGPWPSPGFSSSVWLGTRTSSRQDRRVGQKKLVGPPGSENIGGREWERVNASREKSLCSSVKMNSPVTRVMGCILLFVMCINPGDKLGAELLPPPAPACGLMSFLSWTSGEAGFLDPPGS